MAAEVTVTANWPTEQEKKGKELYLLEKDMAILRVDSPFGLAVDFNMPVFTGPVQPGKTVKVYGRGIYQLATGSGDTATSATSRSVRRAASGAATRGTATRAVRRAATRGTATRAASTPP